MRRVAFICISCFAQAGLWLLRGINRDAARHECVILYYHGIKDQQVRSFRRQMLWLKRRKRVVPLAEALRPVGTDRVCLTFDDALANVARNALPVLRELHLPATVFAVSGNLGAQPAWDVPVGHPDAGEPTMTATQLREMHELFELGSHTHTHPRLSSMSEGEAYEELRHSKAVLERLSGVEVASLSLPYGDEPAFGARLAAKAGYERTVTCARQVCTPNADPFRLGRFSVTAEDWMPEFRLKAGGAYRWLGWLRDRRTRTGYVRWDSRTQRVIGASPTNLAHQHER